MRCGPWECKHSTDPLHRSTFSTLVACVYTLCKLVFCKLKLVNIGPKTCCTFDKSVFMRSWLCKDEGQWDSNFYLPTCFVIASCHLSNTSVPSWHIVWCDEHADFTAHKTVFCGQMCNNAATVFPVHRSGVSNVANRIITTVWGQQCLLHHRDWKVCNSRPHCSIYTGSEDLCVYVKAHGCFYCFCLNVLRALMSLDTQWCLLLAPQVLHHGWGSLSVLHPAEQAHSQQSTCHGHTEGSEKLRGE